jgi:hypothetical protein
MINARHHRSNERHLVPTGKVATRDARDKDVSWGRWVNCPSTLNLDSIHLLIMKGTGGKKEIAIQVGLIDHQMRRLIWKLKVNQRALSLPVKQVGMVVATDLSRWCGF